MRKIVLLGFGASGSPEDIAICRAVGADTVILGLDNEDDDLNGVDNSDYGDVWSVRPQLRKGRAEATLRAYKAAGFKVGVHVWGRPVALWMEGARRGVGVLHAAIGLDIVMIDWERHGGKMDPVRGGFRSWGHFVAWAENLWRQPPTNDAGAAPWPELWLACYGYPNPRAVDLASMDSVRGVLPMVYGDLKHTGLDPMPVFDRSVQLLRAVLRPDQILAMGVGAYDMARPDTSAPAMVRKILTRLEAQGVGAVGVWSLPWLRQSPNVAAAFAPFTR